MYRFFEMLNFYEQKGCELMGYNDDLFKRTNPTHICSFLLNETSAGATPSSYRHWTQESYNEMLAQFKKAFPEQAEREAILSYVHSYAGAMEACSMELGLKAGARLMLALLQNEPQGA